MSQHEQIPAAPRGESLGTPIVRRDEPIGHRSWPVWNTALQLVLTSRERLGEARRLVIDQVAAIDEACNPHHPASEVRQLQKAQGRAVRVSILLAELVAVSLRAAVLSDGDLDPLAGFVLKERHRSLLRTPPRTGPADDWSRTPDWRWISRNGRDLTVPPGALLDLGAMAGPYAADRCARLVNRRLDVGVRVAIGGDVVGAGPVPVGGWEPLMRTGASRSDVPVEPGSFPSATSTVTSQRWPGSAGAQRYTFRPGTDRSSVSLWRSVSVATYPCTYAKTLAMVAMLRGHAAPGWLRGLGVDARLVGVTGEVITIGRWPEHAAG
jgi:thiamine biosynthesis lipoprotein